MRHKLTHGAGDRERLAPCHRCGWNGVVHKISFWKRRTWSTPVRYTYLCIDCETELSSRNPQAPASRGHHEPVHVPPHAPKRRRVA